MWKGCFQKGMMLGFIFPFLVGCKGGRESEEARNPPSGSTILRAHLYDSGFSLASENYNSCFSASDGKVYYVLSSGSEDVGGQMYALDSSSGKVQRVGDLTEAAGEKGLRAIPQGKSHVNFVEFDHKLFFATDEGYSPPAGRSLSFTPVGYKPYPGGHFLSYDLRTGSFEDIAKAPEGEGILSLAFDGQRGRIYGLTWPSGLFLRYDLRTHELRNFGPVSQGGEKGIPGSTFRVLCRSLALDPGEGSVYFTTADGDILQYRSASDSIEKVEGCTLKKDVFGCLDPAQPGTMGYNWRQTVWYPTGNVIYGVHGRSGYLLCFDPRARKATVLERLVSDETRASGMYDAFKYGNLGLTLGPDGHTIYELTGAPSKTTIDPQAEDIHFVTYDIASGRCIDHGVLELEDGTKPFFAQSIAVGQNGMIYTVAKAVENGRVRLDLLSFRDPAR